VEITGAGRAGAGQRDELDRRRGVTPALIPLAYLDVRSAVPPTSALMSVLLPTPLAPSSAIVPNSRTSARRSSSPAPLIPREHDRDTRRNRRHATTDSAASHEVALRETIAGATRCRTRAQFPLEPALVRRRAQRVHQADRLDVRRDRVRFGAVAGRNRRCGRW
jgi:hypothetical protein